MKMCSNCSNIVENNAAFCDNCGARLVSSDKEYEEYLQSQQYSQLNGGQTEPYCDLQYDKPKKSKKKGLKWWQTMLIIFAVVGLIGAGIVVAIVVALSTFLKNLELPEIPNEFPSEFEYIENILNEKDYTKGEVIDNVYINEWANIKLEITEQWPEATDEVREGFETSNTEYGFLSHNSITSDQLAIGFEDLTLVFNVVDEESYLANYRASVKQVYDSNNVPYTMSDYFYVEIAGEEYMTLKTQLGNGAGCQYTCVRKLDNYMIAILVTLDTEEEIKETLKLFKEAK